MVSVTFESMEEDSNNLFSQEKNRLEDVLKRDLSEDERKILTSFCEHLVKSNQRVFGTLSDRMDFASQQARRYFKREDDLHAFYVQASRLYASALSCSQDNAHVIKA